MGGGKRLVKQGEEERDGEGEEEKEGDEHQWEGGGDEGREGEGGGLGLEGGWDLGWVFFLIFI